MSDPSGIRSRNLSDARSAFERGDAASSIRAHSISTTTNTNAAEGGHSTSYNDTSMAIKMGIYKQISRGALFCLVLISTLSFQLPWKTFFVMIVSLGVFGGFIIYFMTTMDHSIEAKVYDRERCREAWELKNYRKGEVDEIIELFESRGVSHDDASLVVNKMANYDDFFVDLMIAEELMMVKPLPIETTPYRFVAEGGAFAGSMILPAVFAQTLHVMLGGTYLFWGWFCCSLVFLLSLFSIYSTNQLKSSSTVVYYGVVTLLILAINTGLQNYLVNGV
jgi:hypothetical protein